MVVISSLFILLTVFYIVLMSTYRRGWKQIPAFEAIKNSPALFVTVIVPARNEVQNIVRILNCLQRQNYPVDSFEIILADDHSDDQTIAVANSLGIYNLRIIELAKIPGKRYKKAAITEAIKQAKGDIIVTTDADCAMSADWLTTIVLFFEQTNAALVSGPVLFDWDNTSHTPTTNFLLTIQQLEFAGLVGIGGAALQLKFPNMCNGANLAYRRQVFEEVGGYMGNDNLLSGDDEFLMHKVFSCYPDKVHFLKHPAAIVKTPPSFTWGQFLGQRMRWVSKSTKYSDKRITAVLAMAYLFNLLIVVSLIAGFFSPYYWVLFGLQLGAKIIVEYFFYSPILRFFGLPKLRNYIIPAEPFHIGYVLAIGILGNFGTYNWKGRKQ